MSDRVLAAVVEKAKIYWKQDRPYLVDERVKSLIKSHSNYAYPSGHTADSYVIANILTILFPKESTKFYVKAEEIAQHRVLVGMHFQRDLNGGRQLSKLVMDSLMKNKDFLRDLDAAKKEIKVL
jgi:acid phosphatase (class A)